MDGRQKPDALPENGNDLNDEEIIDLTQVVQKGNDDEIIDLTNVLDQLEKEPTTLDEAVERLQSMDEDIIDLNNVETTLEADISANAPADEDEDGEDVIDLLDAVEPESPATATDELADLEIRAETTFTEELDLTIAQEAPPTDEADQDPTPPETMEDDDNLIIDLTGMEAALDADIADTALEDEEDDEDVIDLLDAVEPEALAPETDELADLETRAETTLTETFDSIEDPDIGIAQEAPPAAEADQDPTPPETMEDDDNLIIDLTGMEAALDADIADTALEDEEDDEDVIDLLDAVEPEALAPETDELADLETRAETMLAETLDSTQEPDIGIAEETSPAFADPSDEEFAPTALSQPSTTDTVPFTEQQLEAALERTIHRIYAEKIEHLMIQTIEKTVQREIEKIKRALLEDDDELSD